MSIHQRCHIPAHIQMIQRPEGRVLAVRIEKHRRGVPTQDGNGRAWMRDGESLAHLREARRREIYAEIAEDFSASFCEAAILNDISGSAVEAFRHRWLEKLAASSREKDRQAANRIQHQSMRDLLRDVEALVDDQITWAALILFGTHQALGKYLPQAEIVFEYRSSDAGGPAQERENFREGFFAIEDQLWRIINKRNDNQTYQSGLYIHNIPTFAERPIRELILNAVSHRDYQHPGSVFLRQYPRRLVCESPGGLLPGVTPDNILDKHVPRNRRIAEIFERCGLVERSGQGMDLMVTTAIRQAKAQPSFDGTDDHQVNVTLNGQVQEPRFVQFLESIGQDTLKTFDTEDFLILDLVRREEKVPDHLKPRSRNLRDMGIIESVGRGRGARLILSRRAQSFLGQSAAHTRQRGLDREHNLQLLLTHLHEAGAQGAPLRELQQVIPSLNIEQIRYRLNILKNQHKVTSRGVTKAARWYIVSE